MKRFKSQGNDEQTPKKFKTDSLDTHFVETAESEPRKHPSCLNFESNDINDDKNYFENDSDPDLEDFNEYLIDDLDNAVFEDIEKNYEGLGRYYRVEVVKVTDKNDHKIVECTLSGSGTPVTLRLSGEWYYHELKPGVNAHITTSTHIINKEVVIDNASGNYVIVHPDVLVAPTTISNSVRCLRKSILQEVLKPSVGVTTNEVMLLGTINHALFDAALKEKNFSLKFLETELSEKLIFNSEIRESLSSLNMSLEDLKDKLKPSIQRLTSWGSTIIAPHTKAVSFGEIGSESVTISEVTDIEENIWSPKYGCKGKVDATVRIHGRSGTRLAPLEVKSGQSRSSLGSIDHRAQVILYSLMLEERYREQVKDGLLYYIKGEQTIGVNSSPLERRSLLIKRNEVASALHSILSSSTPVLPPPVTDKQTCRWCDHQLTCTLAHLSMENQEEQRYPNVDILKANTENLNKSHLNYFSKFARLCLLESQGSKKITKMPWNEDNSKINGMILSKVYIDHGFFHTFNLGGDINIRTCFVRRGDYVIISKNDKTAYNVIAGFVTDLSADQIQVFISDKDLRDSPHHSKDTKYLLTKHVSNSVLHSSLGNLVSLMAPSERSDKWRRLLIDKEDPSFSHDPQTLEMLVSGDPGGSYKSLNGNQRKAIERALTVQDYMCIVGMPGSGKTSTIACLVEMLVQQGYTVLLTSYTHSAVDNLIMKLPPDIDIVRLGSPGRVHESVKHVTSEVLSRHISDPLALRQFYLDKSVVASTCLGMGHFVFDFKRFDFCIIDEASQITQPTSLGPILHSDRCILVGDHHQLPPLVQSKEARNSGLDESLFKVLTDRGGESVVELTIQYRMCREIMQIANTLTYDNKLHCGTTEVANASLALPNPRPASSLSFVNKSIQPSTRVIFIDTSPLGELSYEKDGEHSSLCNESEVAIVTHICDALINAGVKCSDIGILSPYNGQIELFVERLGGPGNNRRAGLSGERDTNTIEILTADKYQGRDKACIFISFVRSNKELDVGALLADAHRLNVALTRAKCKLIMVGNRDTLNSDSLFKKLFAILDGSQAVLSVDPGFTF